MNPILVDSSYLLPIPKSLRSLSTESIKLSGWASALAVGKQMRRTRRMARMSREIIVEVYKG
jgi:hypothetical protein